MKNYIITSVLFILFSSALAQSSTFDYGARYTPSIKEEKVAKAISLSEIMPDFCRYFTLPHKDHFRLTQLLEIVDPPLGASIFPKENYAFPMENYNKIIDFVSTEISTSYNNKIITSVSKGGELTQEQKNIINAADLGSNISIKIKFKFKKWTQEYNEVDNIIEGKYVVTVVSETEAEYPGGFKQMTEYLEKNIINKVPEKNAQKKIQQAMVKFTINEEGKIVNAKIVQTSTDPIIDKLILDATSKMPTWNPAKNSKGQKVKQEFLIPFGGGGC